MIHDCQLAVLMWSALADDTQQTDMVYVLRCHKWDAHNLTRHIDTDYGLLEYSRRLRCIFLLAYKWRWLCVRFSFGVNPDVSVAEMWPTTLHAEDFWCICETSRWPERDNPDSMCVSMPRFNKTIPYRCRQRQKRKNYSIVKFQYCYNYPPLIWRSWLRRRVPNSFKRVRCID